MILEKLAQDLKDAMRAKDKVKLVLLRSLKADLKYAEIDKGDSLNEKGVEAIFKKAVKSREQSIELYVQGGRQDLVDAETLEVEIIKTYLPKELTTDELVPIVDSVIEELNAESMKDMGKVMGEINKRVGNRADGKLLSSLVMKQLKK